MMLDYTSSFRDYTGNRPLKRLIERYVDYHYLPGERKQETAVTL